MDGHISRINEQVIDLCRKYNTYFLLQPSHTSLTHQPLDNGINAILQKTYNKCYASNIAINPNSLIDNVKRMRILVNALTILKNKQPEKLKSCWENVAQPGGIIDVNKISKMKYDIGKKFRDISLPKFTNDMIKNMFTLENLCLPPGFPISVPTKHFAKPPIHLTIELVHQMNKQQAENEEGSRV
jgi:hypothetical protein